MSLAAACDNVRALRDYVRADPNCVHLTGDSGETALLSAAFSGNAATLKFLLDSGSDLDAVDDAGRGVLHNAIVNHRSLIADDAKISYLMTMGADVGQADEDGCTPLHYAADFIHSLYIVETLLNAGASRTARNHKGETAYDLARARADAFGTYPGTSATFSAILSLLGARTKSAVM